jgi:hypothetical protein
MIWKFKTKQSETNVYVDGYECLIKATFAMISDIYEGQKGHKKYIELLNKHGILTETDELK